jgi:hypothetical protein
MKRILNKRYIIGIVFGIVFTITMIHDIPSWMLGSLVQKYSAGRLRFYDTRGTFWNGSGLLVAMGAKLQTSAPILLLNWNIKLGTTKFIDIDFNVGNKRIAEFYIDKSGSNLDKLDLSMSITQVEKLFDIIKDMSISGNVNISADHISIGKKMKGNFTLTLDNISSGISRVNPLGSYIVTLSTDTNQIEVSTKGSGSVLTLEGNGSINSLILEGRIKDDSKEDMMQFITLMGIPKANGAYQLKIF